MVLRSCCANCCMEKRRVVLGPGCLTLILELDREETIWGTWFEGNSKIQCVISCTIAVGSLG